MKKEDLEVPKQEAKEIKKVESSLLIESTKPAFKLPDGEVVDMHDYLVWIGNLLYEITKRI